VTSETSENNWNLVKIWRAIGVAHAVISVAAGALLFITNVGDVGMSYSPNAAVLALMGGLLILFSPLGLLVPFTIAKALERSERIEAALAQLAGRS
jgi:hypothetical protein